MVKYLVIFLISASSLLLGLTSFDLQQIHRAKSSLLLDDFASAKNTLHPLFIDSTASEEVISLFIQILALSGESQKAIEVLREQSTEFPSLCKNYNLLDEIAWSILEKGGSAPHQSMQFASLMGACSSQDVRAVPLLESALQSSNIALRELAAKLSGRYGDRKLIVAMKKALKTEEAWSVRIALLNALASLHDPDITEVLENIVGDSKSTIEERLMATQSLVGMYESADQIEIEKLLQSKRSGLRALGIELIRYFFLTEYLPDLFNSLSDASIEVRVMAIHTLGILLNPNDPSSGEFLERIQGLICDDHPFVSLAACWFVSYYNPVLSSKHLQHYFEDPSAKIRALSAAIASACSTKVRVLLKPCIEESKDQYLRANFALNSFGLDSENKLYASLLSDFLKDVSEPIMITDSIIPLVKIVLPSEVTHIPQLQDYPKFVDEHCRLHLLNILAVTEFSLVEELFKEYLKKRTLGLTYVSASTLLEEGGIESIHVVKELLNDEDPIVRLQAAIVLTLSGDGEEALEVLEELYPTLPKEMKCQILEVVGHIGSTKSIPFLVELLDDPFANLRALAAAATLQCTHKQNQ